MKRILKITFFSLIVFLLGLLLAYSIKMNAPVKEKISAYLRVKNEIQTIEATLNSIDGLFDRIVLTYSNEPDDGSIAFMHKWCADRSYCDIYEYPYVVYPSLTQVYREGIKPENTMAAYGNFGIGKFEPEEWIVNIDADQVYIRDSMEKLVNLIRSEAPKNNSKRYCIRGYNTLSWRNRLVKIRPQPIMGTYCDHYAIKQKNLEPYKVYGDQFIIKVKKGTVYEHFSDICWFHFKKVLKDSGRVFDKETIEEKAITYLSEAEADMYIKHIAAYFPPTSPYSLYNMTLFNLPFE